MLNKVLNKYFPPVFDALAIPLNYKNIIIKNMSKKEEIK